MLEGLVLNNIAVAISVVALFVAVGMFGWEIFARQRRDRYNHFLVLLSFYRDVARKRHREWEEIQKSLKKEPKTTENIEQASRGFHYLLIRLKQDEKLNDPERNYLQTELRCLHLLNELCREALQEDQARHLLLGLLKTDIQYYQQSLPSLDSLQPAEGQPDLGYKVDYGCLEKLQI